MALIPRAVIGKYANGTTYGLKVSLPGVNALTADDTDATKFSFNSEWTDFVKIHHIGIFQCPTAYVEGATVSFPALPFSPFVEIRRYSGNIIWDDYLNPGYTASVSGVNCPVGPSSFPYPFFDGGLYFFIVYKLQVPVA